MFRTVSNGAYAPTPAARIDAEHDQRDVAFARLPGDFYVAVWFDVNYPGTVRAQRFDGNGRKVGAEVEVGQGRSQASVAATGDGGFLVAWKGSDGSETGIQARVFDSGANPLGPATTVSTTNNGFLQMPEATALANGGYVVVWKQQDNVTDRIELYAQILDAAGAKTGGELLLARDLSYYPGVDVVGLAGGGFAVTWTEPESGADLYGGNSTVRAMVYSANGGLIGEPIRVNTIEPGGQANSQLVALPDGGFYAVWTDDGGRHKRVTTFNGNEGVWLQRFDAQGRKVGEDVRTGETGFLPDMPTLALSETGVFVTWSERYGNQFSFSRLKGQFLDIEGNAQGAAFELGNEIATAEYETSALLLANGSIVLGWNEAYYGAMALQSQLLIPVQHGTASPDSFAGSANRDYYAAGAGNDIVSGGAEADGLAGQDGDDRLYGEAGDDQLYGGAGQDYLYGDVGNDRLDGGGGSDNLYGGGGDDVMIAGVGRSSVDGGAGDDRLEVNGGRAPGDTLVYGTMGEGVDNVVLDYSGFSSNVIVDWNGLWLGTKTIYVYTGVRSFSDRTVDISGVERLSVTTGSGDDSVMAVSPDGIIRTGAGNDRVISLEGPRGEWATLGGSADGGEGIDRATLNWSDLGPGQSFVYDSGNPAGAVVATDSGQRFLRGFEILEEFHSGEGNDRVTLRATGIARTSQHIETHGGDDVVTIVSGAQFLGDYFYAYLGDRAEDHLIVDFSAATVGASAYNGYHELGGEFFLIATYGRRTIIGGSGDDVFGGGESSSKKDVFFGGGGDDVLRMTPGDDEAHGGTGNDRLEVQLNYSYTGILFDAAAAASSDGLGGYEGILTWEHGSIRYSSIENFTVRGTDGSDHIITGDGDDILDGGYGIDVLEGGAGDDVYIGGSRVIEHEGGGTDEVRASGGAILSANVENLTATSDHANDFRGNSGNNVITGGGGNDQLRLYDGGNDTVLGGGGNDNLFLIGSLTGADIVNGGEGNDTLVLQGDYAGGLTLTANVTDIELISILAGSNANFGESGSGRYDYVLTTHDANFSGAIQARINGSALLEGEDFTFDGSAELDSRFVVYGGRGVDTLTGSRNNDIFFLAEERFATGDTVNGGAGYDGMFLRGNYTIDFNAPGYTGLFTNIENLTLTSATDERYARGGGTEFDYNLVLSDAIVKPGETLTVSGTLLMAGETMILDASAETDGFLSLFGGKAGDTLKGGALADLIHGNLGADILAGNGGADVFRYQGVGESTGSSLDHILDFAAGTDKVDLSRMDADTLTAGNQAFTWIGSNAFSGTAGQLRAYQDGSSWFVEGDTDGDGAADLVVQLTLQGSTPLAAGDFLL